MQNILHEYKAIRLQTQNTQRDGYTKSQPGANERLRHTTHRRENTMTKLQPENTSRKLDSLGRVVIPKNLRDKYGINENDEIYFYTMTENGQSFIALTNGKTVDPKYAITANVLEELGVEVPQQLLDMINNK